MRGAPATLMANTRVETARGSPFRRELATLTREQKMQLYRDGFIILKGVVPRKLTQEAKRRIFHPTAEEVRAVGSGGSGGQADGRAGWGATNFRRSVPLRSVHHPNATNASRRRRRAQQVPFWTSSTSRPSLGSSKRPWSAPRASVHPFEFPR